MYADADFSSKATRRFTSILDTGAGSSLIMKSELPPGSERLMRSHPPITVNNSSGNRIPIEVQIRLGTQAEWVTFNVVQKLGTTMLLYFEFRDKHVEAIPSRKSSIELGSGVTVPIVLKPSSRLQDAPLLPGHQEFTARKIFMA